MELEKKGYKFTLIDEPYQKHVVAWEKAMRSMNSEAPKEILANVASTLAGIRVDGQGTDVLFSTLQSVSKLIGEALRMLGENETATLSSHRGILVKAAIRAEWITSEYTEDSIDFLPPWVVKWIASEVAGLYNKSQEIPPN